jgi:hypothetical protein
MSSASRASVARSTTTASSASFPEAPSGNLELFVQGVRVEVRS